MKHRYLTDYHIHSNLSFDGHDTVDSVCMAAIKAGIKEIAVTDHFEPWIKDPTCEKTYDVKKSFEYIKYANEKYGRHLKVRSGVEVGQAHTHTELVENLLKNDFDYVIGSLHVIDDKTDLALERFNVRNYKTLFEKYFTELYECVKTGLFDCVGHMDYPKRYAALSGIKFSYGYYMEIIEQILKSVIDQGKGIELNYSGFRQKINESLPSQEILKMYKELGGINITIGSDAHRANVIGIHSDKAAQMLESVGFNYITVYEKRKPKYIKI